MDQRWLLPSIGTLLLWSLYAILPRMALVQMLHLPDRAQRVMVYEWIGGTVVIAVVLIWLRFQVRAPAAGVFFSLATGVSGLIGALLYMIALRDAPIAAPVIAFTSLYPAVGVFLSYTFLRERPTPQQWAGILLATLAVTLISAGSKGETAPAPEEAGGASAARETSVRR